jgi:predicted component of type VI protein secretion system
LSLRTTLGILTFIGIGGAVTAGAIAFANTITTHQPLQAADLRRLIQFPAPNTSTKADRLPVVLASFAPAAALPPEVTESVPMSAVGKSVSQYAAVGPEASVIDGRLPDDVTTPAIADRPSPEAKPNAAVKPAAVKPAKPTNVVLNDAQIASLKQRLRLTPDQEQYWPEIEAALRAVVKQIYEANRKAHGATVPVDTSTAEVERLKTAAMPFLMQMRADQKSEIIMLARVIGLEKMVAML